MLTNDNANVNNNTSDKSEGTVAVKRGQKVTGKRRWGEDGKGRLLCNFTVSERDDK